MNLYEQEYILLLLYLIEIFPHFQEVFERYFEIDNTNMSFKEEQERSVLSIFHQVCRLYSVDY